MAKTRAKRAPRWAERASLLLCDDQLLLRDDQSLLRDEQALP